MQLVTCQCSHLTLGPTLGWSSGLRQNQTWVVPAKNEKPFQPIGNPFPNIRARWFQLFVMESFGELSYSAGYRKKHSRLYGFGLGGLLYPAQALPMWQNSIQGAKNRFLGFLLLKSDLMLAISTQPSSVTKRNIMDRMEKVVGTAYTPHQCSYGDRKLSSLGGNLQNTFCALFYLFTLS